mgnify:FL=1|tara:strand:- start:1082 stop:1654 length:573 start_codon:yes stop_codon:yes gene_type:complete
MIYVLDNFIDKELFKIATSYLEKGTWIDHKVGEKHFYTQESNNAFDDYVLSKLSSFEGKELKNILSFFRMSNDELDTNWRIHADAKIKGEQPDRALVLYMSPRELEEIHGTAFYEHDIYGKELPMDISNKEFDLLLTEDSEMLEKWRLTSVVGYEQNRVVSYPSNYFHSKYPNKSWKEGREVFVMFYKFK